MANRKLKKAKKLNVKTSRTNRVVGSGVPVSDVDTPPTVMTLAQRLEKENAERRAMLREADERVQKASERREELSRLPASPPQVFVRLKTLDDVQGAWLRKQSEKRKRAERELQREDAGWNGSNVVQNQGGIAPELDALEK